MRTNKTHASLLYLYGHCIKQGNFKGTAEIH